MTLSLTKIFDLTQSTVERILAQAFDFKTTHDKGIRRQNLLDGKAVSLIFEKPSLRTKAAFEIGTTYLGGVPVYLSSSQILASGNHQAGRESIPDIGRNLERFTDLIVARVYRHSTIVALQSSVGCPVINALCDRHHPTQALADLMVLQWHLQDWRSSKVAYIGDGNNVATSLMQICALMGVSFAIASPKGYEVPEEEVAVARSFLHSSGQILEVTNNPREALRDADAVYTDTFVSMGQEQEREDRLRTFVPFQVNKKLMGFAKPHAIFLHCLPAHRGEEVTDEVIDGGQSVVFDQAECRLHVAKAIVSHFLSR
jgi:ornithine carbamoyltransferase